MKKRIAIVGAGASGLLLASLLNKHLNFDVTLFEKYEHVGKKLLITGNGRCNFTNLHINSNCYNNSWGYDIASSFDCKKYFEDLGMLTTSDNEGRVYPNSLVSNTILDILRDQISNINVLTSTNIVKIKKEKDIFYLTCETKQVYEADILILASGGKTYYKDTNSYTLASMLSHQITLLRPSLTPLKVKENLVSIENIRCKVKAKLLTNNKCVYEDEGEVLFKKDALSGIVIFQLSSIIARYPSTNFEISLDLLPKHEYQEIVDHLNKFSHKMGMFPKMLMQYVLKNSYDKSNESIAKTIKNLKFHVVENIDFKGAQITSGGIKISELTSSLESKYVSNLFMIGEMVDVDGLCGGYNLQFAFASAYVSYLQILKKAGEENEKL